MLTKLAETYKTRHAFKQLAPIFDQQPLLSQLPSLISNLYWVSSPLWSATSTESAPLFDQQPLLSQLFGQRPLLSQLPSLISDLYWVSPPLWSATSTELAPLFDQQPLLSQLPSLISNLCWVSSLASLSQSVTITNLQITTYELTAVKWVNYSCEIVKWHHPNSHLVNRLPLIALVSVIAI